MLKSTFHQQKLHLSRFYITHTNVFLLEPFFVLFVICCSYQRTPKIGISLYVRGVCRFLTSGLSQHLREAFLRTILFFFLAKEMFSIIAKYFIHSYFSPKCYDRIKIIIWKNVPTPIYIWLSS